MEHPKTSQTVTGSGVILRRFYKICLSTLLPVLMTGCLQVGQPSTQPQSAPVVTQTTTSPATDGQGSKTIGIVSVNQVNIRKAPSTDGEILGQVEEGSVLVVLQKNYTDNWHQVEYMGKPAFIRADLIELPPTDQNPAQETSPTTGQTEKAITGTVKTGTANIRSTADISGSILGLVYGGESLIVTKPFYSDQWHEVDYKGKTGYIRADLLNLETTE